MKKTPLHDKDFYGWINSQAKLLQEGRLKELDVEYLVEELLDMSASKERELRSRLEQLMLHLLKWQFQPGLQGRSWLLSIEDQRNMITELLEDNPSLKPKISEMIPKSHKRSMLLFEKETGIDRKKLPVECPYSWEELINEEFLPK
jgi:Domain of unknown function DUF29